MSLFAGTKFYREPTCDRCGEADDACQCEPLVEIPEALPPEKQTARLSVEKRKKGKLVTVVRGLQEGTPEPHFSQLLTELKNHCGAGGSIQVDTIEIQGDHLDRLQDKLKSMGYRCKR